MSARTPQLSSRAEILAIPDLSVRLAYLRKREQYLMVAREGANPHMAYAYRTLLADLREDIRDTVAALEATVGR